jgi:hypothetical protein
VSTIPSRTEAVLNAIKHAILTGRFRPGQALEETEIAEQLGVSKTPVREALKTLAGSALVTMSPYKGGGRRRTGPRELGRGRRRAVAGKPHVPPGHVRGLRQPAAGRDSGRTARPDGPGVEPGRGPDRLGEELRAVR